LNTLSPFFPCLYPKSLSPRQSFLPEVTGSDKFVAVDDNKGLTIGLNPSFLKSLVPIIRSTRTTGDHHFQPSQSFLPEVVNR
jgi:hypothetical protein